MLEMYVFNRDVTCYIFTVLIINLQYLLWVLHILLIAIENIALQVIYYIWAYSKTSKHMHKEFFNMHNLRLV